MESAEPRRGTTLTKARTRPQLIIAALLVR